MSSFSGSTLAWTLARDGSSASSYTGQTWSVSVVAPIRVESFTVDIRSAGDYELKINGTVVATVNGVAAATNGVVFTLGTPLELASGVHAFSLTLVSGASTLWYTRANLDSAGQPGGTGERYLGWEIWQEPAGSFVPGSLAFKVADGSLLSYIDHTTVSSGTFAAQTWTVTFDTAVSFTGLFKRLTTSDTTGYLLKIDGTTVATVVKPGTYQDVRAFIPASPVALAAGAHTFKIEPSSAKRFAFNSGTAATPTGDAHVTGWSVWSESTGNKVPARLFYRLPDAPSTTVTGSQGTETDTAQAGSATVGAVRSGAQASEADSAQSGTPKVGAVKAGTQATETDVAQGGAAATGQLVGGAQAAEADAAQGGTATAGAVVAGSQAVEADTAQPGSTSEAMTGAQAGEVDDPHGGSTHATVTGTQATETDEAQGGSVTAPTDPTAIDLSTFIDLYTSTAWDGTSLTAPGGTAYFTFPLELDPTTTYAVEVDYTVTSGAAGEFAMYSLLGPTETDADASTGFTFAEEIGLSGAGTLTLSIGPGVLQWDAATAAGERYSLFYFFGNVEVTGIRIEGVEAPPPPPTAGSDTTNDAYKLTLGGWGVATWDPEIVLAPVGFGVGIRQSVISAIAYGEVTMQGTQPVFTYSEADRPRLRQRILLAGRDVTYDGGVPTPDVEYELADLLLYGPGSLDIPAVMAAWEMGTDATERTGEGRRVKVQLVDDITDPEQPTIEATIYKGFVLNPGINGRQLSLELGGEAQGRLTMRDSHVLFRNVHDISRLVWRELTDVGVRFLPRLGEPGIGINSLNFGETSKLEKVEELLARAVKKDGTQRAVLPNTNGVYRIFDKDTETAHFSVFVDDAFTVPNLSSDLSEKPNSIYATAIAPSGMRIDGAAVPGLISTPAPDYPNADNSPYGIGTTNADTDSGDGVSIMLNRLGAVGFLDIRDVPGGYDDDAADAVQKVQRKAGLFGTGTMNPATWRALWDLGVTGRDPSWSTIQPTAQDPSVQRYLRSASGAPIGLNPDFDVDAIEVDESIDMGTGIRERQVQNWAETRVHAPGAKVWYGTITLHLGAVLAGQVDVGDTITGADLVDARLVQPGRHNLWVPNFDGGTLFGVSGAQVNGDTVVFTVDTRFRPARQVWERLQVRKETRSDPGRRMMGNRQSTRRKDAVRGFISWGGLIDRDVPLVRGWNVIEVVAGDYGTMQWIDLLVQNVQSSGGVISIDPAEYAVAVFGKPITAARLNSRHPNPLTISGTRAWQENFKELKKDYGLLYSAGTHAEPCGYFPGRKKWKSETGEEPNPDYAPDADTNDTGPDDDETITVTTTESFGTLTGQHVDDGTFPFVTENGATVFLAVRVSRPTTLRKGRVLWPVLEGGV